jgi:hypothetical protein
MNLVYVNHEQAEYERELTEWLRRMKSERRCCNCEVKLGVVHFEDLSGMRFCEACGADT